MDDASKVRLAMGEVRRQELSGRMSYTAGGRPPRRPSQSVNDVLDTPAAWTQDESGAELQVRRSSVQGVPGADPLVLDWSIDKPAARRPSCAGASRRPSMIAFDEERGNGVHGVAQSPPPNVAPSAGKDEMGAFEV